MPKRTPKIKHHIICDDIRREIGNKVSLMGVYGDAIIFSSLPTRMPKLCFRIVVENIKTDSTINFKLLNPEKEEIASIGPNILSQPSESSTKKYFIGIMDLEIVGVEFKDEGTHVFQCNFDEEGIPLEIKFKVQLASRK